MSPEQLLAAHRQMWNRAFGPAAVLARLARGARSLSRGAMMLSATMNGFYGLKQVTGNEPAAPPLEPRGTIRHPAPGDAPARLSRLGLRRAEDTVVHQEGSSSRRDDAQGSAEKASPAA